jgi:predicted 2-oxoglutarate/Fe(II)-dependent dioxygenase YbiX
MYLEADKNDPGREDQQFIDGRKSLVPSGYFGKKSDMIFIVDDLITEEETLILLNAAKTLNIWDENTVYKNKYSLDNKLKELDPIAHSTLQDVTERFKDMISEFFNSNIETYNRPLSRWEIGTSQKPHADKEWSDGTPAEPNFYDIGSVIYLNDEYNGGELYFTQHNITIKPEARSGIAFPGDMYFLHGVTPVENTERYTIPIFWTVTEYEKHKDKTLK